MHRLPLFFEIDRRAADQVGAAVKYRGLRFQRIGSAVNQPFDRLFYLPQAGPAAPPPGGPALGFFSPGDGGMGGGVGGGGLVKVGETLGDRC